MTSVTIDATRVDRIVRTVDEFGVCIEPDVISTDRSDEVNAVVQEILEREMTDDIRSSGQQRIGEIAIKHHLFRELMCHPLVLAVWRRLLGEDMVCSTWTANTIHPGAGTPHWHVDHPFSGMKDPYPTDWLAAQTVWMLDDLTEEKRCHRIFAEVPRPASPTGRSKGVAGRWPTRHRNEGIRRPLPMAPGGIRATPTEAISRGRCCSACMSRRLSPRWRTCAPSSSGSKTHLKLKDRSWAAISACL